MKRICFLLSAFGLSLLLNACNQVSNPAHFPAPTLVNPDQKEEGNGEARANYEQLIHRTAPGVDWENMDQQTMFGLYKDRKELNQGASNKMLEVLADGNLTGEWTEKGSLNQAGNLVIVDYDKGSDQIYGISAGGIIWRGNLSGAGWTPLNDDLRFSTRVLKVIPNGSGGQRILAAIGKNIWYSDDQGLSWSSSTLDIDFYDNWGSARKIVALNDANNTLYYLAHTWDATPWASRMWLYYSTDRGNTFDRVTIFEPVSGTGGVNSTHTSLWSPLNSSLAYVLHQGQELYELNGNTASILNTNSTLPINTWLDMEGHYDGSSVLFYALMNKKDLYVSADSGQTWTSKGPTNVDTWAVGITVSPFDPNSVFYGAVECYRSENGGSNWSRLTPWWRYYSNPDSLHADIMDIKAFDKTDGTKFVLVANHGGLHVSYDNMVYTENIGLVGLNIAQYYDVRTDPLNNNYIYGGTQDQGFQKTTVGNNPGAVNFDQVVSGDYGHFAITNNGLSLWKVYPFGSISYYNNAQASTGTSNYNLGGSHPPVADWIFPTSETWNPASNTIYVAGGNISGGTGSYLVELTASTSAPYSISATQGSYNFRSNSSSGTSTISAIEPGYMDPNRVYVSTSDGTFFYSNDGGSNWNISSISNGPGQYWLYGACILASKLAPNKVLFAGSGYSSPPVFISNDGGQTFTSMSNGLPNTLVHEIVANADETLYFAATEVGPFVYVVSTGTWYPMLGTEAPIQRYYSVEYVDAIQTVRFGTYGRGIWDFDIQTQPVPVELLSFDVRLNSANKVQLNWESANEINSSRYEVERSQNGINFEKIQTVQAAGNSLSKQEYETLDARPFEGLNYYRLKVIDEDESYEYTPIRSVELDINSTNNQIYPNPAKVGEELYVDADEQIHFIKIWNSAGQEILKQGVRNNAINTQSLAPGVYFYQFLDKKGSVTGKAKRLSINK